ncbi:MAG: hypothetical protein SGJ07_06330 [Rhodospirillaceae bacterium]|mgnify:CR=1 FL=1|nr:hypothetical protein [Rhodospirillaceae bacterium]
MRRIGPPAPLMLFALALGLSPAAGADEAPCCADFRGADLPVHAAYYDNPTALNGSVHESADEDVLYSYWYATDRAGSGSEAMLAVYSLGQDRLLLEQPFASGDAVEIHLATVAEGPFDRIEAVVPAPPPQTDARGTPVGDVFVRGADGQGTITNVSYNSLTVVDESGATLSSIAMIYLYKAPKTLHSEYGFDGYVEETRWMTRLTTLPPHFFPLPDGSFLLVADRAPILIRFDSHLNCIGCEGLARLRIVPKDDFDRTLFGLEDVVWQSFGLNDPDITPAKMNENFDEARREGAQVGLAEEDWAPHLWVNWKLADLFENWNPAGE